MTIARSTRRTLLLTGVAEGLGADIAETFARAGYDVVGISRTDASTELLTRRVEQAGGKYTHLACDIAQATEVVAAIKPYADLIDVLIHNAHVLDIKPFEQTTASEFEQAWRVACLGAMVAVQAVIPHMAARGAGRHHFDRRHRRPSRRREFFGVCFGQIRAAGICAIAGARYGPKGVHVAHIVIDGLIDEPQTDQRFGFPSSGG